jgi:hypothetical protein
MKRMGWFFTGVILLYWTASPKAAPMAPYYEGKA